MKLYVINKSESKKGKKSQINIPYIYLQNVRTREILKQVFPTGYLVLNEGTEQYALSEIFAEPDVKYPFLLISPVGILLGMLSHDILIGFISLVVGGVIAEVFNAKDAEAAIFFNNSKL